MIKTKTIQKQKVCIFSENGLEFGQDFAIRRGVPQGINFVCTRESANCFILRGENYGEKDNYGNGAIFLYKSQLQPNDRQKIRCTKIDAVGHFKN